MDGRWALVGVLLAALACTACNGPSSEMRAREAAKKIKASIPDVEAKALAQKVSADVLKQAQTALTKADDYQGDINGKLDSVTVNAIEAFQRAHDLTDNGILDARTRRALQAVLAQR
jgi:peptidoglycan hydrolase-like protein with peptidoglycan-binding domain